MAPKHQESLALHQPPVGHRCEVDRFTVLLTISIISAFLQMPKGGQGSCSTAENEHLSTAIDSVSVCLFILVSFVHSSVRRFSPADRMERRLL
jgi:hypothetical protein